MAVIGVTRNVRLRRRGASGFGFSLRGGREYAAGFYVSDVQPGGEAHRNGLRVSPPAARCAAVIAAGGLGYDHLVNSFSTFFLVTT